jgi:peptidoglycan/LPS O-acetylase OafA/YrhL
VTAAEAADAPATQRVAELDGLRGVAILLVLLRHYAWGQMETPPTGFLHALRASLALTWSGVDLFFVLSGFLLTGLLLHNRESPSYYRTFYVRRFCRIVPPYYLMIAVSFAWMAMVQRGMVTRIPFRTALPPWTYLTFTQNLFMARGGNAGSQWLAVTWSLAVEEQFYLCLPFLVRVLAPARFPYLAAALVLAAPAVRMALFDYADNGGFAAYVLTPARADALLLGALIAWGWRHEGWRKSLAENRGLLSLALAVLLAGAAVLTPHGWTSTTQPMVFLGYTWLAVLYAVLLLLVLTAGRGPLGWVMRWRWLRGLGRVSYVVYLVHLPVSRLVFTAFGEEYPRLGDGRSALLTLLAVLASVAVATLSWWTLERPILRWGHTFKY